jgi:Coenzyme F420-reducing hydrogenase, alpha subunit
MKGLKDTLENHVELIKDLVYKADFPEDLGKVDVPLFVSDPTYGNPDAFEFANFSEVLPEAWYGDEAVGKRACTTIPLLDGKNVETGPRARMEKFAGFKDKGTTAQHIARAEEMLVSYDDVLQKLDQLDTSASARAEYDPRGTGELGIGVVEAPRGTNVHMAKVVDGKMKFYSAIVPTTWNIPTMGPATEGFSHELAPHVIRAYDPCLSCATHVMVVDEEKNVLKNENMKL